MKHTGIHSLPRGQASGILCWHW